MNFVFADVTDSVRQLGTTFYCAGTTESGDLNELRELVRKRTEDNFLRDSRSSAWLKCSNTASCRVTVSAEVKDLRFRLQARWKELAVLLQIAASVSRPLVRGSCFLPPTLLDIAADTQLRLI